MTTIHVPETIDGAKERLGTLGTLLTAKGWERAALVYAFTYEPGSGRFAEKMNANNDIHLLTSSEFAALGIHGLGNAGTVLRHRRNWQKAIDNGWATDVQPGDDVVLPTVDFDAVAEKVEQGIHISGLTDPELPAAKKIEIVHRMLASDPAAAKSVEREYIEKIGKNPETFAQVQAVWEEYHPIPTPAPRPVFAGSALGWSSTVYMPVLRAGDEQEGLLTYFRSLARIGDPQLREFLEGENATLDKAVALIRQYQKNNEEAAGVDVDAEFAKIMGRG